MFNRFCSIDTFRVLSRTIEMRIDGMMQSTGEDDGFCVVAWQDSFVAGRVAPALLRDVIHRVHRDNAMRPRFAFCDLAAFDRLDGVIERREQAVRIDRQFGGEVVA